MNKEIDWISVEDSLPDYSTCVLCLDKEGYYFIQCNCKGNHELQFLPKKPKINKDKHFMGLTYWMPFPSNPTENNEND